MRAFDQSFQRRIKVATQIFERFLTTTYNNRLTFSKTGLKLHTKKTVHALTIENDRIHSVPLIHESFLMKRLKGDFFDWD